MTRMPVPNPSGSPHMQHGSQCIHTSCHAAQERAEVFINEVKRSPDAWRLCTERFSMTAYSEVCDSGVSALLSCTCMCMACLCMAMRGHATWTCEQRRVLVHTLPSANSAAFLCSSHQPVVHAGAVFHPLYRSRGWCCAAGQVLVPPDPARGHPHLVRSAATASQGHGELGT
jgi:hypothetical protein